jgi:hypothetical protein
MGLLVPAPWVVDGHSARQQGQRICDKQNPPSDGRLTVDYGRFHDTEEA